MKTLRCVCVCVCVYAGVHTVCVVTVLHADTHTPTDTHNQECTHGARSSMVLHSSNATYWPGMLVGAVWCGPTGRYFFCVDLDSFLNGYTKMCV